MPVVRLGSRVQSVSDLPPEDQAIWNADRLQGVFIDISGLSTGEFLVYDGTDFVALPLGGDKTVLVVDLADPSKIRWGDHGDITGLGDDDHTQYILENGTRPFSGDQSMGGFNLTNVDTPVVGTDAANKDYVDGIGPTLKIALYQKAADYMALAENQLILGDASGGAITITLPPAATAEGLLVRVKKVDASANAVTVDGDGAETIDDMASIDLAAQYTAVALVSDGTEWWIV